MEKVLGQFYFKQTTNGNLIGEFTNNSTIKITAESATLIKRTSGFVGTYSSTWEHENEACITVLTIDLIKKTENLYSLRWVGDGYKYWGEGFIVDNMLIGHYRDFEEI